MTIQAVPYTGKTMHPVVKYLLTQLGKILLVIVISTAAGWIWFYMLFDTGILGFVMIKPAVVIELGVCAGFTSRFILKQNNTHLRWLTAFIALISGLLFMNYGSTGMVGFSLTHLAAQEVNWSGLWQLTLGGLLAAGALTAWKKSPAQTAETVQPQAVSSDPTELQHFASVLATAERSAPIEKELPKKKSAANSKAAKKQSGRKPKATRSTGEETRPLPRKKDSIAQKTASIKNKLIESARSLNMADMSSTDERLLKVRAPAKSRVKQQRPASMYPSILPRKKQRPKISLVGMEEHRCPYCLEEVDPDDPAGVMICPVCHSYHHKSCWDITGTCQVPHSQS